MKQNFNDLLKHVTEKQNLKLLGEQLFDRCEELGIELTLEESVAIRDGMVMVCWDADAKECQLLPPWIPTASLANEIVRRQKARGSQ